MEQQITNCPNDEAPPSSFVHYRDYLHRLYLQRKQRSKSYSFVRFAADLGLPTASVIHQIIKGRRKLTAKAAQKLVQFLGLKGVERTYFLKLVDHNNAASPQTRESLQRELVDLKSRAAPTTLARDQLAFVSEWYHPVIRELVALNEVSTEYDAIARSLLPKIRPEQVRKSIELLVRLGLISKDPKTGSYIQNDANLSTLEGASDLALARFQQVLIDLGRDAISTIEPDLRHVTAISIRLRHDQIAALKKRVQDFNLDLLALEATVSEADEIYQINLQMFPLTQLGKQKGVSNEGA